jgi:hypothetical protein
MINFFKSLLSDERGQQSTKRVLALIGTLFLCATLIVGLYVESGNAPSDKVVSAIEFIVIVCIGATTVDKFSHRVPKKDTPPAKKP